MGRSIDKLKNQKEDLRHVCADSGVDADPVLAQLWVIAPFADAKWAEMVGPR